MKIIKLILAVGILVCLFLPLSKCTGISEAHSDFVDAEGYDHASQESDSTEFQKTYTVISDLDDMLDVEKIPVFIGFLLPLLCCFTFVRKKWNAALLVLQTANQLWLIYLTCGLVWFLSEPLWGGYLLTFCVAIYTLITIVEWINLFRKKQPA